MSVTECPICNEEIKEINCCTTPCGHMFHMTCFMEWNRECPLCRQSVNEEKEREREESNTEITLESYMEDLRNYLSEANEAEIQFLTEIEQSISEENLELYMKLIVEFDSKNNMDPDLVGILFSIKNIAFNS